jgi:hypothetical protein
MSAGEAGSGGATDVPSLKMSPLTQALLVKGRVRAPSKQDEFNVQGDDPAPAAIRRSTGLWQYGDLVKISRERLRRGSAAQCQPRLHIEPVVNPRI